MSEEEIIHMARKAGVDNSWDLNWFDPHYQRFTDIVVSSERDRIALLVEQMGMWGYGTLAIDAAIRSGTKASELDDISSPADRRKLANRPWSAP